MFRRKNSILTVLAENIFAVFEEICVFREKCIFMVLTENTFYGFGGKYVFAVWMEKVCFEVLAGKVFFHDFGGKSYFLRLWLGNSFWRF